MGATLDLDDVAATSETAKAEEVEAFDRGPGVEIDRLRTALQERAKAQAGEALMMANVKCTPGDV